MAKSVEAALALSALWTKPHESVNPNKTIHLEPLRHPVSPGSQGHLQMILNSDRDESARTHVEESGAI
jgi:hypothetical protein